MLLSVQWHTRLLPSLKCLLLPCQSKLSPYWWHNYCWGFCCHCTSCNSSTWAGPPDPGLLLSAAPWKQGHLDSSFLLLSDIPSLPPIGRTQLGARCQGNLRNGVCRLLASCDKEEGNAEREGMLLRSTCYGSLTKQKLSPCDGCQGTQWLEDSLFTFILSLSDQRKCDRKF